METVTLEVTIESDCNYMDSDGLPHTYEVNVRDVDNFIAGLTLHSFLVDGCTDDVHITVDGELKNLDVHKYGDRVLMTYDGEYEDEELNELQSLMEHEVRVGDLLKSTPPYPRLAMDVDGFVTLFGENPSLVFLQGIAAFEEITKEYRVRGPH
jgi:hypothetical protein